jgi:rhodanese-related sulfurtransferase
MEQPSRFQKLVAEAKKNIVEMSPENAADKLKSGEGIVIDVRERDDWKKEHVQDSVHLSRGEIELEIEEKFPDPNTLLICHCGGGGRSALVAESLQKMGYKNVRSMAGGLKAWKAAGLPTEKG